MDFKHNTIKTHIILKNNNNEMKTWSDITLQHYYQIKELLTNEDEYTVLNILDVLYGIDSASLPISALSKYNNALDFLKDEIPVVDIKKKYNINGHTYDSNLELTKVSTAQFIDYQNYLKEKEPRYEKLISVFFIPENHQYNEGYSIKEVQDDILHMSMVDVQSIAFFIKKQFQLLLSLFQFYLTQSIQKMHLNKDQKQKLLDQLNVQDLSNLESFLTLPSTVKKP